LEEEGLYITIDYEEPDKYYDLMLERAS